MRRRAFAACAACASLRAGAQGVSKGSAPARIAWISGSSRGNRSAFLDAFRIELEELGKAQSSLPVELPTVIEHVINLRSAKAMGLTIPRSALLRADEIIG